MRGAVPTPVPTGAASAQWRVGGDALAFRADPFFAGAISSIVYRGRQYLDASDHGREMQGPVQFGSGECLNPTLAGASRDPPGTTTSRLLAQEANAEGYRSLTRMAFWDRPGQRCSLAPGRKAVALNGTGLSDLTYAQDMHPGYRGRPHAVLDRVVIANTVLRPPASAEVLTAYMPRSFDTFLIYDPLSDRFQIDRALQDVSGERPAPVILSTRDGSAAMGVVGLGGEGRISYAGYRGPEVSKWSLGYDLITG